MSSTSSPSSSPSLLSSATKKESMTFQKLIEQIKSKDDSRQADGHGPMTTHEIRVEICDEFPVEEAEEGCDNVNHVSATSMESAWTISTTDGTAASGEDYQVVMPFLHSTLNNELMSYDMALGGMSTGLALRSFPRFTKPDKETHLLIKVMASIFSLEDSMKCSRVGLATNMMGKSPRAPGKVIIRTIEGVGTKVDHIFELGDRVIGMMEGGGCSRFLPAGAGNFVKAHHE